MDDHPPAMPAFYPEALALVAGSNTRSSLAARRLFRPGMRPFAAWAPESKLEQGMVSVDATDQLAV